jgi:hypothetical protein
MISVRAKLDRMNWSLAFSAIEPVTELNVRANANAYLLRPLNHFHDIRFTIATQLKLTAKQK